MWLFLKMSSTSSAALGGSPLNAIHAWSAPAISALEKDVGATSRILETVREKLSCQAYRSIAS